MELKTIKAIGQKISEISLNQQEEKKVYMIYDDLGGQITLTFNKKHNRFNGHNHRVTEGFSGMYSNNILSFNTQDGKTITLTLSEIRE
ncbi:hypothetical protein GM418_13945 [Maribellus comscasis]|uniref:Uncharacterized protein n=1 Tax=Maribellus comscasis TaxID=2681766 RepID=A0A6I6JTY7_9BACT|nr:hypothetical protein [Maribellus comscasis]QGY44729.1 hypothetical protein GM418_13945 [Maribellus comscasis]